MDEVNVGYQYPKGSVWDSSRYTDVIWWSSESYKFYKKATKSPRH